MTTKFKIIGGFAVMILLIGGMAFLGYKDLGNASARFDEYSRLALLNVNTSDSETELVSALAQTYDAVLYRDPVKMKRALETTDHFVEHLKEGQDLASGRDYGNSFADLQRQAGDFKKTQQELERNITALFSQYNSEILTNTRQMSALLNQIIEGSRRADNVETLHACAQAWSKFGPMLAGLARFAYTRSAEDAAIIQTNFTELDEALARLERNLRTGEGTRLFDELEQAYASVRKAYETVKANGAGLEQSLAQLIAIEGRAVKSMMTLNDNVDAGMRKIGQESTKANATGQKEMLYTGILGIIVGAALAALIVFGFMRMLADLVAYADAVARGDFTRQVKTREKGEIGAVVKAMKSIPEVLRRIITTADGLSYDIRSGRLRNRLTIKEFQGSFGELAVAVNTVGDAYTEIIDDMPLPVMAADTSFKVQFFNRAAQTAVGGNLVGAPCSDSIHAPECKTANCFGARTMESGALCKGETSITCNGADLFVNVTAMPLKTADGKPLGFIEILTDLTEIKRQEGLMRQIADEAAEISNRVAAASEELAAQVEQISQGAEIQRDRVTSTAGAMTEMNATVLEVARSAGEASEQSEGTRQKAQEGAELVNRVMAAINAVNAVGQNLQGNMQELGKQAESIGSVMNVISDIADQTNLLALNAAIEAARAGEAGRGFAVVADEVRKLAEKTMEATQEVGSSIHAVQQSARVNIEEVSKAVASVAEANSLADSSGTALTEIVNLAASNSAVVASIATAAEEQSATSEEINRAIDEINQVVGETAEGMTQSASAVQGLSQMAQELRNVMERLK